MDVTATHILLGVGGYLIGSFPTGVVLSRRKYHIDVREMGSGNIGATNVTRVFGWYAGAVTLVADFFKGFVPIYLTRHYFPGLAWTPMVVGLCLVLGHCFSLYLGFRGGKGVATGFGCVAAFDPILALVLAAVYVALLLITRISAVGSLGGVVAALVYVLWQRPEQPFSLMLLGICGIILVRHIKNIRRLIRGG
ncbi:MAG: glycerol-3-phosphate 1-O-acyltransferase PlsY [Bdellovibrionales bacterium]|nr:glycerol-3-phosphate 1-O-acyltransferase PlsY [Bdellovibrionales bacterium]